VKIEILTGGSDLFGQLEGEWRALCDAGAHEEAFYRPEVIRAYIEAFVPDRRVVIFTARIEQRLVAVLPMVQDATFFSGLPIRTLRTAGNVHTCRYDMVHAPEWRTAIVSAMWHALKQSSAWDVLEISGVPAHSALTSVVHAARTEGFPAHAIRAATSPYIALGPAQSGFEHTLARVNSKFKANLRRRMRKLQSRGTVRLVRSTRLDDRLERFYELENASWKGTAGSAIIQDTRALRYYNALAREAERFGYFSLYSLECDDKPVAMQYGFTHRGRYSMLKTAYDPSLADCSPGQLLTLEVLRDITARGCMELDFLGVSMEWKRDWVPRLRPHADWYVFRGARGSLLHLVNARARRALGRTWRRWNAPSNGTRAEGSMTGS
jgi:CelD/BcsL family acetyltransferase involved in cellulose biosynthesis